MGQNEIYYYPDILVACTREGMEKNFLRYPTIIAEVLSPSTRSIDLREKLLHYVQIPTLQEYVIASQEVAEAVIYRRCANWAAQRISGLGASLELQSIERSLPLSHIYEKLQQKLANA